MPHAPNHWYYEMQELGFNYRITDFQCALGISQMEKLEGFVKRRREIAAVYNEAMSKVEGLIIPTELAEYRSSYHLYPIQITNRDRDAVFHAFRAKGGSA